MIPITSIVFTKLLCRAGGTALIGCSLALIAEVLVHTAS